MGDAKVTLPAFFFFFFEICMTGVFWLDTFENSVSLQKEGQDVEVFQQSDALSPFNIFVPTAPKENLQL
jgi:hypothetical protein